MYIFSKVLFFPFKRSKDKMIHFKIIPYRKLLKGRVLRICNFGSGMVLNPAVHRVGELAGEGSAAVAVGRSDM